MKQTLYILTFLIFITGHVYSQNDSIIDSLTNALNETESDSSKLEILFQLVKTYGYNNLDTGIYFAQQARELAIKLKDESQQAKADVNLAGYYTVRSNYQKAMTYDLEAVRLYKKLEDGKGLVQTLNNVGEDYYDLDLFTDAYDYYQKSLKKAEQIKDTLAVAIATYNIGRVLKSMGQLKKSITYIERSLKISRQIDDQAGLAYSYHDIGEILIMDGKYREALEKLEEALIISKKLKIKILTPQIFHKIALAYENLKQYETSLSYHDSALVIYQVLNGKSGIAQAYLGKGVVRMKMKNYEQAREYLTESLTLSQAMNNRELMIDGYLEFSKLYENRGLFKQSLEYYKKYKAEEDSVFGEKKSEQFAQIQIKYEMANKDMEIALLNQKEEQGKAQLENEEFFRNILVVILAFTAILLITLYRSGVRRKKINNLLVQHQREMEEQSREMAGLLQMKDKFFSILSHDLRSPINALIGTLYIIESGNVSQEELKQLTKTLETRLLNTKKLLDNLLDWALIQMDEITIQSEEIDINKLVDDNLRLFKETSDKNVQFFNNVPEETIAKADRNMVDLILRNLLANAVKFTDESGIVEVTAEEKTKDTLMIKVKDSGIGMNQEQRSQLFNGNGLHTTTRGTDNERGTGLGLKLCKEFIDRMGGEIDVESEEGKGSIFSFTLKKAPLF